MAIREIPSLPFVESVKDTLQNKYCCFTGRSRRSEFWYFTLFSVIVSLVISIIGGIFGDTLQLVLSLIVNLALFLPSFGLTFRRLHDINKSGWWWLLSIIPVIGWIILIVWFCKDSDPLPNQYGVSPKYVDAE